jgi:hypothetical protein
VRVRREKREKEKEQQLIEKWNGQQKEREDPASQYTMDNFCRQRKYTKSLEERGEREREGLRAKKKKWNWIWRRVGPWHHGLPMAKSKKKPT